jgi:hypothetical protein
MVHGNLRVTSIFTNKAGEWKLGGFELLCSMKEESPIILVSLVPFFALDCFIKVIYKDIWWFGT